MGAVIDKKAFDTIRGYIEYVKSSAEAEILYGGSCDDTIGYFVEPTVVLTTNPHFRTMEEEMSGLLEQ
jgi:1-pyrroline-5-carboxylate dehydrogenase